ncbi:hypothetical protein E4U41_003437, partial [Claviceps citrina]
MAPSPSRLPVIRIARGTFYRRHPDSSPQSPHAANPSLFDGLTFDLPASPARPHNWCVVGPSLSGKTTFLQILRGGLLCEPPTARSWPFLSQAEAVPARLRVPQRAIRYVGFDTDTQASMGAAGVTAPAFLSARYESRREMTDFTVRNYLLGHTELNPLRAPPGTEGDDAAVSDGFLDRVVRDLGLQLLLDLPVTCLSNGQGRRARIGRALLTRPEVLLLDEPFIGLDPRAVLGLSPLLQSLADKAKPRLVLSARPQDPLPEWITHLVYLRTDGQIESMGPKETVLDGLRKYAQGVRLGSLTEDEKLPLPTLRDIGRILEPWPRRRRAGTAAEDADSTTAAEGGQGKGRIDVHALAPVDTDAEPLVEMDGCRVQYGDKIVLGNWSSQQAAAAAAAHHGQEQKHGLVWTVRRGERWGVFGPNGSGKTTIVSLLSSDHPQAYALPIRLFGRSRLPEPGSCGARPLTFWDIQSRIGHSSPEVHRQMPRSHTIRNVVENAWAATLGTTHVKLDGPARQKVDAALRWFAPELLLRNRRSSSPSPEPLLSSSWADQMTFGELSLSAQRVALFVRAVIKAPDVVVLDEAFSGMDDAVRDKCALFLAEGLGRTPMKRGRGGAGAGDE